MTKKVAYSLKMKLIFLISSLLLAAIGFYTFFAADLFQKDKEAYVFENALSGLDQFQKTLENYDQQLAQYAEILLRIQEDSLDKSLMNQFVNDTPEILAVSVYQTDENADEVKPLYTFATQDLLERIVLNQTEWDELISSQMYNTIRSPSLKAEILLNPLDDQMINSSAKGVYLTPYPKKNAVMMIFFDLELLAAPFSQQRIFDYALRDKNGEIVPIVTNHQDKIDVLRSFFITIFQKQTQSQHQGVRSLNSAEDVEYLVSYTYSATTQLQFISLIPKKMAFAATAFLVQQSILVGLIVLSLAVIIGIVFSKTLTNPLELLYQATQKMSRGDFQTRVQIKGSDEIHSLGESFNEMSEKILGFMEEMKEKTRLENELAVAKLVQDSFFPPSDIEKEKLSLHSFYHPATECGGDWWGTLERSDQTLILLADATGHGVPAAFLTATVYSCIQTLDQLTPQSSSFTHGPAEILSFMNKTVSSVGKNILLTAVAIIVDKKTGQLTYANASHLDPLILRVPSGEEPNKQHFIPLLEAKGPRLGHKEDALFEQSSFQLQSDDKIIIWTDGITEATNTDGKEWGMRKFIQALLGAQDLKPHHMRDNVLNELKNYHGERPYEDDVTFVCGQWKA